MTLPSNSPLSQNKPKAVIQPLRSAYAMPVPPLQPVHSSPRFPSFCSRQLDPSAVSQTRSPSSSEPSHVRMTTIRCHLSPLPNRSLFLPLLSVSSSHLLPPNLRFMCFFISLLLQHHLRPGFHPGHKMAVKNSKGYMISCPYSEEKSICHSERKKSTVSQ